ncbi:hypothetical protein RRG08_006393 [Elysia crispata]|uniref:Uncharacterized protein n=1 Tax=Elysia crispata TaxID=231223 RepID=A0AAE1CRI4_9GAST|nr:hypothetical protein RRG08_006393 [Elysia crispata]
MRGGKTTPQSGAGRLSIDGAMCTMLVATETTSSQLSHSSVLHSYLPDPNPGMDLKKNKIHTSMRIDGIEYSDRDGIETASNELRVGVIVI